MFEIIRAIKRKLYFYLFILFGLVMLTMSIGYYSTGSGIFFLKLSEANEELSSFRTELEAFYPKVEEAKRLGEALANVKYQDSMTLKNVLFKELESMGMAVSSLNLDKIESGKYENVPGLIRVDLSGKVPFSNLQRFMKSLSLRSRVWGIENLTVKPSMMATDMVSQFLTLHRRGDRIGIEEFVKNGRTLSEQADKQAIEIKMSIVVVIRQGGGM